MNVQQRKINKIERYILKIFKIYKMSPIEVKSILHRNMLVGEFIANNYDIYTNGIWHPYIYNFCKKICCEYTFDELIINKEKAIIYLLCVMYRELLEERYKPFDYETDMIEKILSVLLFELKLLKKVTLNS